MSPELTAGDRIRVAPGNRLKGYAPGETGRLMKVARVTLGLDAVVFYYCEMDCPDKERSVAFYPDEVKLDG
jgi:hypothetical protein